MNETKPHIWIEPTRPPANSSREFGDTAAVMITGLAILYSEMAEADQLRLECSVNLDCHRLNVGYTRCTLTNPVVSLLVEIDLEANTWAEVGTHKDGTQTGSSGKLRSVTQYEIVIAEMSYADGSKEQEKISRTSGAYSYRERQDTRPIPTEIIWSGTCKQNYEAAAVFKILTTANQQKAAPSTGSATATTIKSQSSSNLVQSVVGLFNARLC